MGSSEEATNSKDSLDYIETPLNACSLETFCQQDSTTTESSSIPLCLGCYQLNETTQKREGRLDLYDVPIHDAIGFQSFGSLPLTIFGDDNETDPAPGVLDGKWSNHNALAKNGGFRNYYATAHANGEIWVHEITRNHETHKLEAKFVAKSESPSNAEGLCLALAWESPLYSPTNNNNDNDNNNISGNVLDTRIISSYSDGYVAIHTVRQDPDDDDDDDENNKPISIQIEHHWESHNMFGYPSEVWCANFIDSNTVVTGGDEGSWKIWDLRQDLSRPVYHGKRDFEAGVTVLAPHPQNQRILAVGSYDESVGVYDLRNSIDNTDTTRRPRLLYHSNSLGGGIWRLKWHPLDSNKLLVAAMHGGCVVGEFHNLPMDDTADEPDTKTDFAITGDFKLHKSMAYGIDWLTTGNGVEAAASCSFYDKAMYLWNTDGKSIEEQSN